MKSKQKMKKIISALKKIVSFFEIPKSEYDEEIKEFFKDSPELIGLLEQQTHVYTNYLGGEDHCVSTGNVLFRYIINSDKNHIYIVGMIAKSKKLLLTDIVDVRSLLIDFATKLEEDWVLYASVNKNSKGFIEKLKKRAETMGGKKILEKSLGKISFLDKPEFSFDTIVLATKPELLRQPLVNNQDE